MKIAIVNDSHAGIRNSSDIFADNAELFYKEVFFPYCKKHNIKQIIHLGDYYDNRKAINVKTLYRNRKMFLEPMKELGMHMDIIPGNHDTYFKNTNEVNSLKELLGFFINEVNIIMNPSVINYGNTNIAMLPWINSSNYDESLKFVKNAKAEILCGHLELEGFELMRGMINKHGMNSDIFSKFELVLTGHFHTKSNHDNIYYLGSQMEFFWSDANDPKFFHVLDTDDRSLMPVRNPHTLFEKIVYDDSEMDYNQYDLSQVSGKFVKVIVVNKNNSFMFDKFVEKIQEQSIHELKIAENFSEFSGDNVDDDSVSVEDTNSLLCSYIDAVETDLDKIKIKNKMTSVLVQAQSMELQ